MAVSQIDLNCFDSDATPFATFQSHNQKVVFNRKGIFLTYLKTRNEKYTAQKWRLLWSRDKGRTFEVLYESTNATNPAPLETDEDDNLYLIYPDFTDGNSYFMKFAAEDEYADPKTYVIPKSSGGKISMFYDEKRQLFYYFSNNGTLNLIDRSANIVFSSKIIVPGKISSCEYPFIKVDTDGIVHAAWTTDMFGTFHYMSIQYMRSDNGGVSWRTMDGRSLLLPVISDHEGASDMITTEEELEYNTWLSDFTEADGKLHFAYRASPHPDYKVAMDDFFNGYQHYIRYDKKTGQKDFEIMGDHGGKEIKIAGFDGFFAKKDTSLYYISKQGLHIACIVSHDNGLSWQDHSISDDTALSTRSIYAIGGCRKITGDGYIIGSFTKRPQDIMDMFGISNAVFIRIKI